jgi:hypothetical protein
VVLDEIRAMILACGGKSSSYHPQPGEILVEVEDTGRPFDPLQAHPHGLSTRRAGPAHPFY